ncbi:MAG: hypothetical protein GXO86_07970 [Chlorobi bacterium]|nr:hypothetical protein [Chlorobiota bacterium]
MRLKVTQIITLFLVLVGISACSPIIKSFYGIKKPQPLDDEQISKYAEKLKLPAADVYRIDTSYLTFILSLDTAKFKSERKNHYQPLQALYFDRSGNPISFHVNCYAGGFPNLKWNRNGNFDTFPPKTQAPLDSILSLERLLDFIRPLTASREFNFAQYDYVVVVFWNRFMKRQSKRLIRTVQENHRLDTIKSVKVIYINDDNLFAAE